MPHRYQYLIIGGGMTAAAAVSGIREIDTKGSIGLISADSAPPYDRPPLTKALWKGEPIEKIWRHIENQGVELHLAREATGLDAARKTVTDDRNDSYTDDKLLLATGGTPRRLAFGGDDILYFRTLADYRHLRKMTETGQRFAVIGGGFIGSELAAALAINHKEVTLVFPGRAICDRIFPADHALFLNDYYRQKGVDVWSSERAAELRKDNGRLLIKMQSQRELAVDGVVAGLGIEPNVALGRLAGLEIADGIVVDEFLHSSRQDIFAAGDVAVFYNPALERRLRVEHEDNANTMGRLAGRNMAGSAEPDLHPPFFFSDLFDLGYEAVGELDARLRTVEDWKEPHREGVVYYQREGRVRGVLLWNVWGKVDAARELIGEKRAFEPGELKNRLAA